MHIREGLTRRKNVYKVLCKIVNNTLSFFSKRDKKLPLRVLFGISNMGGQGDIELQPGLGQLEISRCRCFCSSQDRYSRAKDSVMYA